MKWILLILMLPSLAIAGGPKYTYKTPPGLDDEMNNIYHDIKYPTIAVGTANTLTISSGSIPSFAVMGTTTSDNAPTGGFGEYISSTSVGAANATTTDQYKDILAIILTPGDWDISGNVYADSNSATWSRVIVGITSTAGNDGTGQVLGDNRSIFKWANTSTVTLNVENVIPAYRVSISATTTYYLKCLATYTAGTPQFSGRISARRVR